MLFRSVSQSRYEDFKNRSREQKLQYRTDKPEKVIWLSCRNSAKRKGVDFSLEEQDIVIPKICPYLQIPITNIRGKGRIFSNPSIDRIDPTKGYVKGNIQIISDLANRMKQDATTEQLIAFAHGVLKVHHES